MTHITGKVYELTQNNMQKLITELEQSKAEKERLREALSFYADEKSYEEWTNITLPPTTKNRIKTDVGIDKGKRARKALGLEKKGDG